MSTVAVFISYMHTVLIQIRSINFMFINSCLLKTLFPLSDFHLHGHDEWSLRSAVLHPNHSQLPYDRKIKEDFKFVCTFHRNLHNNWISFHDFSIAFFLKRISKRHIWKHFNAKLQYKCLCMRTVLRACREE